MPISLDSIAVDEDIAKTSTFADGRAAGSTAAAELLKNAPLDSTQTVWLLGFLQGLVDASQVNPSLPTRRPLAPVDTTSTPIHTANDAPSLAPYAARISRVETHVTDGQHDWLDVALDVDDGRLSYGPGSILTLWPTNDPEEVRRILRTLGVSAQFMVATERNMEPAWQVLLERVNINTTCRNTLTLLAEYSRSQSEASGLISLADGLSDQDRPLLALLRRYPSARPPLDRLLASLARLEPSFVPIASSNLEQQHPLQFAVRSEPLAGGWAVVTSALRSKFRVGEWLTVSVDNQHPPAMQGVDDLDPVIVIADGPGVAFARALVAERRMRKAKGRTWIIASGVGSSSFPYSQDFSVWHRSGSLSRFDLSLGVEPGDTVATLGLLEEHFWRWIVDHSRVYVVGSSPGLHDSIAEWFVNLLARRYKLDRLAADRRLFELTEQGRWVDLPNSSNLA